MQKKCDTPQCCDSVAAVGLTTKQTETASACFKLCSKQELKKEFKMNFATSTELKNSNYCIKKRESSLHLVVIT